MPRQPLHEMLPETTHDDTARQEFVKSLRAYLSGQIMPGNYEVYEKRVLPEFQRRHGSPPADRHQIREQMLREPYYRLWSSLQRRSQEMMWESVIEPTERQLPKLIGNYRKIAARSNQRGTLRLNPELDIPRYHTEQDIHIQPGGYHTEWLSDDVAAGAIYDCGVQMYMANAWGAEGAYLGTLLTSFLQRIAPDFQPKRILDMGCTIGNSTLPWARTFPCAAVHAIDVAAPVLRYGHARAEALKVPVHFSQQNAECTDFESQSFDLVISHIMLHETSLKAMPKIFAESRRLLRPGGFMMHMDIPRGSTPLRQFMHDWESYNNNEGFSRLLTGLDLAAVAREGGWMPEEVSVERLIPAFDLSQMNYADEYPYNVVLGRR